MNTKRNTFIKTFVILGALLLVAGLALFIGGMSAAGWDFNALNTVHYEQKEYTAESSEVSRLLIDYSDADIAVEYSDTADKIHIEYPVRLNERDEEIAKITLTEENGTLTLIEKIDWQHNLFQWNFNTLQVRVTIPSQQNFDLDLNTGNGSISLKAPDGGAELSSLRMISGNGNIRAFGSEKEIAVEGGAFLSTENGKIEASFLRIGGNAELSSSNGNINAESISASDITMETQNGNISLKTAAAQKNIRALSDHGEIILGGTVKSESLQAETDTGNITMPDALIDVKSAKLISRMGNITARGGKFAGAQSDYTVKIDVEFGKSNITASSGNERSLYLATELGNVEVYFER